jgi:hypothetical protein
MQIQGDSWIQGVYNVAETQPDGFIVRRLNTDGSFTLVDGPYSTYDEAEAAAVALPFPYVLTYELFRQDGGYRTRITFRQDSYPDRQTEVQIEADTLPGALAEAAKRLKVAPSKIEVKDVSLH